MNSIEIIANSLIKRMESIFSSEPAKTITLSVSEIDNSHFKLSFHNNTYQINFALSLHQLDSPWQITSSLFRNGIPLGSLEQITDPNYNYENNPRYEVNPNMLIEIDKKSGALGDKIINDLISFLKRDQAS